MTPAALLAEVRARGVTLTPTERGTLKVKPGLAALPPELVAEIRAAKPELLRLLAADQARDMIAEYRAVLGRLWLLNTPSEHGRRARQDHARHAADLEDAGGLLAEAARLCDDLGPEVAFAISRRAAREWAAAAGRCPWCGMAGVYHDPDTGEESALR
jgi:hypothetical protein